MDLVVKENLVLLERRISLSEFHTADEVYFLFSFSLKSEPLNQVYFLFSFYLKLKPQSCIYQLGLLPYVGYALMYPKSSR